jgi:acetyltransferase-like isoleucine patch superfamily enzyme
MNTKRNTNKLDLSNAKMYKTHGDGSFSPKDFRKIGENVIFERGVLVFHPENICIGNNVYIGHNTILKGYHVNTLVIGDHTWIGQNCFLHGGGGIEIGKAVGLGPGVMIISSTHILEKISIPVLHSDLNFRKVVIEDGCDIGIGAIVLPGVRIGEGTVVGAGAVVTKNVGPYLIIAGVPARVLCGRR